MGARAPKSGGARGGPELSRGVRVVLGLLSVAAVVGGVLVDTSVAQGASTSTVRLLVEPQTGMGEIYSLINSAKSSIDMTMYELADSTAEGDLAAAASRGVDVRVILDKDYDGGSINQAAYSWLSTHGVDVHWAPSDVIFHEKAFTVDNSVAAIGTGNLTSKYYSSDRDYWLVDSDTADVSAIDATFTSDWSGNPVGAGSPGADLVWSPGSEPRLVSLIDSATHSVEFESEELSDRSVVDALAADARRGVSCEVLMEATPAWDSSFASLKAAGCRVRTYAQSASLYIHAKAIVVDSGTAAAQLFVGSQNASVASLTYDRELGVILGDTHAPIIAEVASIFATDFGGSTTDTSLARWTTRHRAAVSGFTRAAKAYTTHSSVHACNVLTKALKKAEKISEPPTGGTAWRKALRYLTTASAGCGSSSTPASAAAALGLHALVHLAENLVNHGDQYGNTLLVAMGRRRLTHAVTHTTATPSKAPHKTTTTTTAPSTTTTAPPTTTTTTTTAPPPPPTTTTTTAAPPTTGAWCTASASPADDGHAGDYNVYVSSNQPDTDARAHDATDTYGYETKATGSAVIYLWTQYPGEVITVTVGPAHCSTTA